MLAFALYFLAGTWNKYAFYCYCVDMFANVYLTYNRKKPFSCCSVVFCCQQQKISQRESQEKQTITGAAFAQKQFTACDPVQLARCQAAFNDELKIDGSWFSS